MNFGYKASFRRRTFYVPNLMQMSSHTELRLSRFSTWRICSREQRKKQLDWLATNTDDITSQSHSLFACSREQIRQVENRLQLATCNSVLKRSYQTYQKTRKTMQPFQTNNFSKFFKTRIRKKHTHCSLL